MQDTCLNCNQALATNYCGHCGQKASTHRYSLKHFIEHDFIHGVWHVDKGALYTIKELFTRPGNSVREYILGKRVNYFSFITLLLLTATLSAVLSHYAHLDLNLLVPEAGRKSMNSFEKFLSSNPKIILLVTIPFNSFFSYIWFRRAAFNYSEHLVLNSYKAAAEMIVGLIFSSVTLLYTNSAATVFLFLIINYLFIICYSTWFYIQFFSKAGYSKVGLIIRSLMIPISLMVFASTIGFIGGLITAMFH